MDAISSVSRCHLSSVDCSQDGIHPSIRSTPYIHKDAPFRPSLSLKRSASHNSSQSDAGERHFEAIVEKANRDDVPSGQSLRTHITHQRKSTPRFFRLSRRREVLELVMKQKEFFIPPPCSRT
ncbi:hypothetical protein D8B26_004728 [Coccidioides posadasii str. Silveira]|uniref:uncharacterized protein n=1 Tax=Coccidioides posadasii (strain RMSCC 757 / Silveira) TaxID=443226 RepID=UPI001BEFB9AC|nr:hypothetical protein D8B26_004728 [Coccidioides posadasii str. Silveira]